MKTMAHLLEPVAMLLLLLAAHAVAEPPSLPSLLDGIDYASHVRLPAALAAAANKGAFMMNYAGAGHVDLFKKFAAGLGIGDLQPPGLQTAQSLHAAGTPFVYLTLTNDHQPKTHKAHDATLAWDRQLPRTARVRFIGPPGRFVEEGVRKADFCRMSEHLARAPCASGARCGFDDSLRFSLPCAVPDEVSGAARGATYAQLLAEEGSRPLGPATGNDTAPIWITRQLKSRGIVAASQGMRAPLAHAAVLAGP